MIAEQLTTRINSLNICDRPQAEGGSRTGERHMPRLVSLLGMQAGTTTTTTPYQTTVSGSPASIFGTPVATQPTLSSGRTIQTGQAAGFVSQAYFQIFNADGTPASQQIFVKSATVGQYQSITSIAVTTDGDIVVGVNQSDSEGGTLGFDVYDTNGNPISGYVNALSYSGANSASGTATVSALQNGDFAIQYRTSGSYPGQTTLVSNFAETFSLADTVQLGTNNADVLTATQPGRTFLEGYDGDDTLIAGNGEARMVGDGGNDTFYAPSNGSFAKLFGGLGDDTYYINSSSQQIFEFANQGNDVEISSVSNAVAPNVETLRLAAGSAATGAVAASGNHTLIGNDNGDVFVAQNGNDTLVGGSGNDTYNLDSNQDQIIEQPGGGYDTVYSSANFHLSDNIEALHLIEGSSAMVALGNSGDNSLYANSNGDVLNGLGGTDLLYGGTGADTFQFSQTNFGHQTVENFDPNNDSLSFANFIFSNYSALSDHLAQSGSDVLIVTGDPNNYVTLKNTQLSSLNAKDFSFFGSVNSMS